MHNGDTYCIMRGREPSPPTAGTLRFFRLQWDITQVIRYCEISSQHAVLHVERLS